jgi:hypothetical protein
VQFGVTGWNLDIVCACCSLSFVCLTSTLCVQFGVTGWNLDIEPTTSLATDAKLYATFLGAAKPKLNAAGMRLTIATATWSPMLSDTALLAPNVDRVLNMETYNADSMSGWLNGDAVGGYYGKFVAPPTARSKLGPGLGVSHLSRCLSLICKVIQC